MKNINSYLAYIAVFALLITAGCSKEETGVMDDPANSEVATITFGAMLNDLANRAMTNNSKAHFDQVPDCSDAEPAVAVIEFSYGGEDYSTTVDILHDDEGYFTAYTDDLEIPVTSGSTEVTLNEFMVYDGDTSEASDEYYSSEYGNLIWIAPRRTNDNPDQFAGYVEKSLPFSFDVAAGTKPYIDVEVLCFDRRMVNEYGYVFFNIVPETIYPLCLFANYCNADGRHWVADYSIDLEYGTGDDIMHVLYSADMSTAMATTGTNNDGEFYADPLCLVVPGPPANLGADEPYLTLTVYPQDWEGSYGDIDNSPIVYELSWNDVYGLLNQDGETNEYLHLTLGECAEGSTGDGSGGNGGNEECDNDFDGDGICDNVDADIDGDGILNVDENDGCVYNPDNTCGVTTEPMACTETLEDPADGCTRGTIPGSDPIDYANNGEWLMIPEADDSQPIPMFQDLGDGYGPSVGNFTPSLSGDGSLSFDFVANTNYSVDGYLVEVKDASGDVDVYCTTSSLTVGSGLSYPIYVKAIANVCPTN